MVSNCPNSWCDGCESGPSGNILCCDTQYILSDENVQFTQLLDYYLSDEGKMHLPTINSMPSLAHSLPVCTAVRTVRLVLWICYP